MPFTYSNILEKIISKTNLNGEEALWLMHETMSGNLTPAQISGWLIGMRMKGETSLEISTFASVMRSKAIQLTGLSLDLPNPLLDTCGTGGDRSNLVNISTLSALVLASRGVVVAKHGNRSVSSSSGSADFLERAGYPLNAEPEDIISRIRRTNFGFFFAPAFHPAMKYAGPIRKEIGVRTVFNVLGPLSNPAHAVIHLMGVFSRDYIEVMAEALKQLGVQTALVVHSSDGLDEISPISPTHYRLLHKGSFTDGIIDPAQLHFNIKSLSELTAANGGDAYDLGMKILAGSHESGAEMVAVNAAAGEYLWNLHQEKIKEDFIPFLVQKTNDIKEMILQGKCMPEKVLHG